MNIYLLVMMYRDDHGTVQCEVLDPTCSASKERYKTASIPITQATPSGASMDDEGSHVARASPSDPTKRALAIVQGERHIKHACTWSPFSRCATFGVPLSHSRLVQRQRPTLLDSHGFSVECPTMTSENALCCNLPV